MCMGLVHNINDKRNIGECLNSIKVILNPYEMLKTVLFLFNKNNRVSFEEIKVRKLETLRKLS